MFENLRTIDEELFRQLGQVCGHLSQSTRLLEEMLAGSRGDEARLVHAIHATDREAHDIARAVDARAFKAFVMRVDRMDVHELATALDAAVDAVEKAATHAEALHASGAPDALRSLAGTLTKATGALEAAVPHVGHSPAEVMERVAVIRRLEEDGETLLETGLEQLFSGAPNALDVLRWKDVYEKLAHALGSCANAASALEQVTRSNA